MVNGGHADPWFTREVWPKGDWRHPGKSCLWWSWGRNVRINSWVVFCVLGTNNCYRRTSKGYKQTRLQVFCYGEWCWRMIDASHTFTLCTFVSFDIFAKGMHMLKSELVSRLWKIFLFWLKFLYRTRGWFLSLFVFLSLFTYWPWEYMYFTKCS